MDPELKTHLEKMETRLLDGMETRLKTEINSVLEVVKEVAENTSKIMEKLDDGLSDVRQRVDHVSKRVDYIESEMVHK